MLLFIAYVPTLWAFAWLTWLAATRMAQPQSAQTFLSELRAHGTNTKDDETLLALRESLAAVYSVPPEFITHRDTAWRLNRFSLNSDPVLKEFVTEAISRLPRKGLTVDAVLLKFGQGTWRSVPELFSAFLAIANRA